MSVTFDEVRHQLDTLLAQLAADQQAMEQREHQVAMALEQLSQEPAIAAAWQQGSDAERHRVAMLIDQQLDHLKRGGTNAVVLTALRKMVLEVEA